MTIQYFQEHEKQDNNVKKQSIYISNPNKLMACEWLMNFHEQRGDKVIIFADSIFIIEKLGRILKRPFIHGKVSPEES